LMGVSISASDDWQARASPAVGGRDAALLCSMYSAYRK
jgi:hypothetical protein